jgi:hypothetical protein
VASKSITNESCKLPISNAVINAIKIPWLVSEFTSADKPTN